MQPIDNSDLAWLIIADFLADQNKIFQSEELRDSINNPENENWDYECRTLNGVGVTNLFGAGIGLDGVGGCYSPLGNDVGVTGKNGDGVGTVSVGKFGVGGTPRSGVGGRDVGDSI